MRADFQKMPAMLKRIEQLNNSRICPGKTTCRLFCGGSMGYP